MPRIRTPGWSQFAEGLVRKDEGIRNQLCVVQDQLRATHPGQYLHGKDLLYRILELQIGDSLSVPNINHPYAAVPLGEALRQGEPAEHGAFAHLGQTHEGQWATEVQPASESRQVRHRLVPMRGRIDDSQ